MRTNLFLCTLFAVSLTGGAALADKPVRPIDHLRSHGDLVDKQYKASHASAARAAKPDASNVQKATRSPIDRGANRINCSDTGADCGANKGAEKATGMQASSGETGRAAKRPAFLDKVLGSDRMACNEADECSMSSRAVARSWGHSGGEKSGSGAAVPLSNQKQVSRMEGQASSDRMACNEGDQCMMSSKASKKDWSYAAIKAGTWHGPEVKKESNAARAIEKMKEAETKANQATANRTTRGGKSAATSKDHEH